jgi:N4-gp56 family major capsid protein
MAATTISSGSDFTQKSWRAGLVHEAERQAHCMGFVSAEDDSGIQLLEDLTKKRGDKIQIRFSPTDDTEDGFGDGEEAEGQGEALSFFKDEIIVNYLRLLFEQRGQMSQQRVNFDLKKAAFIKLSAKWSRRFEQWILNQLAGVTHAMGAGQDNYKRTGMNPVLAIDADHLCWGDTAVTADESLTSSHKMKLLRIDEAVHKAMTKDELDYPITPCPDGYYHLIMDTYSWKNLRANTTTGDWQDITKAALMGGRQDAKDKFERGWLGVWNNVKLHVSDYVPAGQNSGTAATSVTAARRPVLIGAMAGVMAFGEGYAEGEHLDWVEQTRDYGQTWGVQADCVGGFKRTIFNGQTYGALVIPVHKG